jgi:hypothetical protein
VPEAAAGEAADATEFRSQAYLTTGIDWPGRCAEMDKWAN